MSNVPALCELMYAAKGEGAFLNEKSVKVSNTSDLSKAYLSSGSIKYFEQIGLLPQLLNLGSKTEWARGIGDAWAYHLVAQSKMTQLSGKPIDYEATTVLASNGLLYQTAINEMKN